MSVCLFLLNDIVVPITVSKSNRIWETGVSKKRTIKSKQKNIWIKGDRAIYHIKYYNAVDQQISGITFYYFNQKFKLTKRLDAKAGRYSDSQSNRWILTEVMEQTLAAGDNHFQSQYYDQYPVVLPYEPNELNRIVKKSEEMNFIELHNYIKEVEAEGYDTTNYKVDLHGKIAFPLVCIVLALAAASISLRRSAKENISVSVAAGIGIVFLYFILHNFCLSLGYGDILPHFLAPWVANAVFACVSGILLLNIN
jgi:lipopolysaccharide export system permease protein